MVRIGAFSDLEARNGMKRLQTRAAPAPVGQAPGNELGQAVYTPRGVDAGCAAFAPLHYEEHYAYPLLVWLHGPGDSEHQLQRIMPLVSLRNFVAVSPRGTIPCASSAGKPGYSWATEGAARLEGEERVFDAISWASSRYHLAPERTFIAGFDCGGSLAFRIAVDHPHRFGGAISIGGGFPRSEAPLANLTALRRLPLLLASGRESARLPVAQVCESLRLFHAAGMHVTVRQYPTGHVMDPGMLADVNRWMMEQVTTAVR
jgi:phospholipase/carboxylesterase